MTRKQGETPKSVILASIGIAFALGWPLIAHYLPYHRLGLTGVVGDYIGWLFGLAVLLWAMRVEKMSLARLGIRRPTWGTLGWGLTAVALTFALMAGWFAVQSSLLGGRSATPEVVGEITKLPFYRMLLICLSAGLVEELTFRFYAITRLHELTGSRWIASIVQLALFVGFHMPSFGAAMIVPVTLGALVLLGLYWWCRDYWCNALAHFTIDFLPFGVAGLAGVSLQ